MIKNIIFDFGDIFINLDKAATINSLNTYNITSIPETFINQYFAYEQGKITTDEFVNHAITIFPEMTSENFIQAWNAILLDFPLTRLAFLKEVTKNYRCFLLSNTNELHIEWIKNDWGAMLYNDFKSCFEQFYLSHEIHYRKPNHDIYEFVLKGNNLIPEETLFIDDTKDNTDAAAELGIHTWNLIPGEQDVINLFTIKKELF